MITKYKLTIVVVFIVILAIINISGTSEKNKKPNILFICVDDLRPELGCYGNEHIKSPNLDRLAGEGFMFSNHYVTVPTSGASRHSLLTGLLPRTKAALDNQISANTLAGKPESDTPETFVHLLKRNGYYTVGIGKISHHPDGYVYGYLEPKSDILELPHSWNEMLFDNGKWGTGHNAFFGYADGSNRNERNKEVKPYECADVDDEGYPDGLIAKQAIEKLHELKDRDEPFLLGVGFFKPHLPFNAPKKYWDMYNEDEIPLAPFADIPENSTGRGLHNSGEFNQYKLGEEKASLKNKLSDEYARKLRHAYFACVSYVDAQIGKLLDELEKTGLAKNTIVVVWGDHGWHLGDHRVWGKHTIFERAVKSAFIVKTPMQKGGEKINKIVSTIDIYPTISDWCGIEVTHKIDGQSLLPLLNDKNDKNWRNTAYSYFRNGISLRTEKYRYTRYFNNNMIETQLYNHNIDPNETKNIFNEKPDVTDKLQIIWEKGCMYRE